MFMKNMEKLITLRCSICGNDQFSSVDGSIEDIKDAEDEVKVKCSDCGRVISKGELIEENSEIIDANMEDFKDEIMQELMKDIKKMFK